MSKRHTYELAQRLSRLLDDLPPRDARRRRRGVSELAPLVEQARDDYLRDLDADDGLAVLLIRRDAVIEAAAEQERRRTAAPRRTRRRR